MIEYLREASANYAVLLSLSGITITLRTTLITTTVPTTTTTTNLCIATLLAALLTVYYTSTSWQLVVLSIVAPIASVVTVAPAIVASQSQPTKAARQFDQQQWKWQRRQRALNDRVATEIFFFSFFFYFLLRLLPSLLLLCCGRLLDGASSLQALLPFAVCAWVWRCARFLSTSQTSTTTWSLWLWRHWPRRRRICFDVSARHGPSECLLVIQLLPLSMAATHNSWGPDKRRTAFAVLSPVRY